MARSDWLYVNLEKSLVQTVDEAVESIISHGSQKYIDRKHFVTVAIRALLDKEKKMEVVSR